MSQQINLFNPIFLRQEKHFSAKAMAMSLGIILLAGILIAAYAVFQVQRLQHDLADNARLLQATQAQLAKVTADYAPRQKDPQLQQAMQRTETELTSLEKVFAILEKGELGNTHGYADYLTAFARQIGDGIWLTGFTIQGAGAEIALRGNTLRPELVPAYLTRLKSEAIMQGASFAKLDMQQPKEGDQADAVKAPYIAFNLRSSNIKDVAPGDEGVAK